MKRLLITFALLSFTAFGQNYNEFFVANAGSNANAGHPKSGGIYPKSYTSSTWVNATRVLTVGAGNPQTDGVQVGDYLSVNPGTDAVFDCQVTVVSTTAITCSATASSGTDPANGTYTGIVGGTWAGPSGTDSFPFNFLTSAATDAAGDSPRVNVLNETHTMTGALAASIVNTTGMVTYSGYVTNPGDSNCYVNTANCAVLTTASGTVNLTAISGTGLVFTDWDFSNTSSSGNGSIGLSMNGAHITFERVRVHGFRSYGWSSTGNWTKCYICEFYGNNVGAAGSNGLGQLHPTIKDTIFDHIYVHDGGGGASFGDGLVAGEDFTMRDSIIFNQPGNCLTVLSDAQLFNDSFYNCTGDGLHLGWVSGPHQLNVNSSDFVKNGGWGINDSATTIFGAIQLFNVAFGQGTQANTSGTVSFQARQPIQEMCVLPSTSKAACTGNLILYPSNSTPWVSPTTGNFSTSTSSVSITSGFDAWFQSDGTHSGTAGFTDLGAAQASSKGGSGTNNIGGGINNNPCCM